LSNEPYASYIEPQWRVYNCCKSLQTPKNSLKNCTVLLYWFVSALH